MDKTNKRSNNVQEYNSYRHNEMIQNTCSLMSEDRQLKKGIKGRSH